MDNAVLVRYYRIPIKSYSAEILDIVWLALSDFLFMAAQAHPSLLIQYLSVALLCRIHNGPTGR